MRSNASKTLLASLPALIVGLAVGCCVSLAAADELVEAERLMTQGQAAQALDTVDAHIAGRPRDPRGRFLKARILEKMGRPNEAMVVYRQLSEDFPELPEPYNNLAVLHAEQKPYDQARLLLEMAIRTHPGYALARENLGDVYARLASESYDQALRLDPANKAAQFKLSKLREFGSLPPSPAVR